MWAKLDRVIIILHVVHIIFRIQQFAKLFTGFNLNTRKAFGGITLDHTILKAEHETTEKIDTHH